MSTTVSPTPMSEHELEQIEGANATMAPVAAAQRSTIRPAACLELLVNARAGEEPTNAPVFRAMRIGWAAETTGTPTRVMLGLGLLPEAHDHAPDGVVAVVTPPVSAVVVPGHGRALGRKTSRSCPRHLACALELEIRRLQHSVDGRRMSLGGIARRLGGWYMEWAHGVFSRSIDT
jgi:hypothetical protein